MIDEAASPVMAVVAVLGGLSWLAKRELGVDDALIYEDEPDPIVRSLELG